jgi:hypothetical protein
MGQSQAETLDAITQAIARGDGSTVVALCEPLLQHDDQDEILTAQVMRARAVGLSILGRGDELDQQVDEVQRFAGAAHSAARFAAAQALIDRALYLLAHRGELAGAIRDSSAVLDRAETERDQQLVAQIDNELLAAARHLIWTDPFLNGPVLPWFVVVILRGVRFRLWSLSEAAPGPVRRVLERALLAPSNPRLTHAERITRSVLGRSHSDFSSFAYGTLRLFTVLAQQGRPRAAIRALNAFRQLGEPAIAGIVNNAAPSRGGGYRDTLRIAAVIGRLDTPNASRSEATKDAIDRILADDHGTRLLLSINLRLTRPAAP